MSKSSTITTEAEWLHNLHPGEILLEVSESHGTQSERAGPGH
ncbi:hypothetical protein J2046_002068 [Rhizobium petrolearium]|nr:hypothetical protein [Neorhizobium petrolearium]